MTPPRYRRNRLRALRKSGFKRLGGAYTKKVRNFRRRMTPPRFPDGQLLQPSLVPARRWIAFDGIREFLSRAWEDASSVNPVALAQSDRTGHSGQDKKLFQGRTPPRPFSRAEEHEKFEPLDDVEEGMMHQGRNEDDGAGTDIESAEVSV
jgi:hypothetical protein